MRQIALGIKEDISDFCLFDTISEAIDRKVRADGGIHSTNRDEWLKNMEQLLLKGMDDLDHTKTCPVVMTLVVCGDVLDISSCQRRNLFIYDRKILVHAKRCFCLN